MSRPTYRLVSSTWPRRKRIQLRRTKGWRKPEDAIVVARPTRWGNPWRIVLDGKWHRVRHTIEDHTAGSVQAACDALASPYANHLTRIRRAADELDRALTGLKEAAH